MSRTIFEKPTETAKMIKGAEKEALLCIAEHDGQHWATNRYWMVPAERVSGYLSVNNLEIQPGSFTVNGHCTRESLDAPKVGTILDSALDGAELLTRAEIAGKPAFIEGTKGRMNAIFTSSAGPVACDAQWLDWITGRLPERYGVRFVGQVRVYQRAANKPIAFVITRERITTGTGQMVGDGVERRYVPEAWENDGEELLGVLMPVRLSD